MSINNICRALLITSIVSISSVDYSIASTNSNKKQAKAAQPKPDKTAKTHRTQQKQQGKAVRKAEKEEGKKNKHEARDTAKRDDTQARGQGKFAVNNSINTAKQSVLAGALNGSINLKAIDEFYIQVSSLLIKVKTLRDREDLYAQDGYEAAMLSTIGEIKDLLGWKSISRLSAHPNLIQYINVISNPLTEHDKPSLSSVSDILSQLKHYINKYVYNIIKELKVQIDALIHEIIGNDEIWQKDEEIQKKVDKALAQTMERLDIRQDNNAHRDSANTEGIEEVTKVVADKDANQPIEAADTAEITKESGKS